MNHKNNKQFLAAAWAFFMLPAVAVYSGVSPVINWHAAEERLESARLSSEVINNLKAEAASEPAPAPEVTEVAIVVKAGDTLSRILSSQDLSNEETQRIIDTFKSSGVPASDLSRGETITLIKDGTGDLKEFRKKLSEGREFLIAVDGAELKSEIKTQKIIETEKTAYGVIETSFADAAQKNSVPYSVIDDLVDVLGARLEFRKDLQPGDTFSLRYIDRKTESGESLAPGKLLSASIVNEGKFIAAIASPDSSGKPTFFDETGAIYGNYFLRYPLQFSRISSVFSSARFHPVLGIKRPHNGVDFAAPTGTPVRAVADGRVEQAGYSGGSGIVVRIQHDSKYETAYLHLSKIVQNLRVGSRVSRGEIIGAVGATGLATGPHLHFSLYEHGKYVDPLKAKLPSLNPSGAKIPKVVLAAEIEKLKSGIEQASALAQNMSPKRSRA